MTRRIRLIADDYGLAPGVSAAILELLDRGRLTGTGCMTGFPEWPDAAARIKPLCGRAAVGLHLTLTDQPAVTGRSGLAPGGRLPPLRSLALPVLRGGIDARDVHAELDAQYNRFVEALGRQPDFIDGHQHVHFLPIVRTWLRGHFSDAGGKPALRGAPALGHAAVAPKVAAIAALATGFNQSMARAGFSIFRPLAGIYDWRQPERFAPVLQAAVEALPERGLFMCHPGHVDETLRARDPMQGVREVEFTVLASDAFGASLARAGVEIMDGKGMSGADQPRRSTGSKIVRFAIVGLVNTAIDLAGFFLLLKMHLPPLPANVISWSIAVVFSFVANGFWSFERNQAIRLHDAFLRFVSLGALISLGVSSLSIELFAGIAGVWPAKIGGVIVAAVLNFLAARWSIEGRLLK